MAEYIGLKSLGLYLGRPNTIGICLPISDYELPKIITISFFFNSIYRNIFWSIDSEWSLTQPSCLMIANNLFGFPSVGYARSVTILHQTSFVSNIISHRYLLFIHLPGHLIYRCISFLKSYSYSVGNTGTVVLSYLSTKFTSELHKFYKNYKTWLWY